MKRFAIPLLLVGAFVLVAGAACGDGPDPVPTPTPTRTATPRATPTVAGTPVKLENPTVTPSGLKYVDVKVGDGATPRMDQTVTVIYTGRLASNGSVFDTSGTQTVSFPMANVIKGFSEGLSTMKVGGKRTVYIPAALGYGAAGYPPKIPGNADLVFDIELVSVK